MCKNFLFNAPFKVSVYFFIICLTVATIDFKAMDSSVKDDLPNFRAAEKKSLDEKFTIFDAIDSTNLKEFKKLIGKLITQLSKNVDKKELDLIDLVMKKLEKVSGIDFGSELFKISKNKKSFLILSKIIPFSSKNSIEFKNGNLSVIWSLVVNKNVQALKLLFQNGAEASCDVPVEHNIPAFNSRGCHVPMDPYENGYPELNNDSITQKYINLTRDYDNRLGVEEKIKFIFNKKEEGEDFAFLIKLAFGRSLDEVKEGRVKSVCETVLYEIFASYFLRNRLGLEAVFDVELGHNINEFIERAIEKNYYRRDMILEKVSPKIVFSKFDFPNGVGLLDCKVITE